MKNKLLTYTELFLLCFVFLINFYPSSVNADFFEDLGQYVVDRTKQEVDKGIDTLRQQQPNYQQVLPQKQATPQVMEVQRLLKKLGYKPGVPDGVLGSNTERAIAAFQRNNNIPANGKISTSLLNVLNEFSQTPYLTSAQNRNIPKITSNQSSSGKTTNKVSLSQCTLVKRMLGSDIFEFAVAVSILPETKRLEMMARIDQNIKIVVNKCAHQVNYNMCTTGFLKEMGKYLTKGRPGSKVFSFVSRTSEAVQGNPSNATRGAITGAMVGGVLGLTSGSLSKAASSTVKYGGAGALLGNRLDISIAAKDIKNCIDIKQHNENVASKFNGRANSLTIHELLQYFAANKRYRPELSNEIDDMQLQVLNLQDYARNY